MSFLNQLKNQAQALQQQRSAEDRTLGEICAITEQKCELILYYLQDLARQLSVIEPQGPAFTLDGKIPWPAVKLVEFRVDARRKKLRDSEVFDYLAMGWRVLPQPGEPVTGSVSVNFPTDMRRVEDRLAQGLVKHDRAEIRLPDSNLLHEVRYDYEVHTRGSVSVTPEHDRGQVSFRLLNTAGFEVVNTTWPVARINHDLLDELAKRIVGQPSLFI
jgi:hypothetical protein